MRKYFYSNGKKKKGPFSFEELKNEEINPETLIWSVGLENWTPAKEMKKFEEILKLIPPPIIFNDNNTDKIYPNTEIKTMTNPRKKDNDKSLLKSLPFLLIMSFVTGLINISHTLKHPTPSESVGFIISYLLILTGLPLLIVRIVKWLSKNKRWDKNATLLTWIIQLILTYTVLSSTFS